MSKRNNHILLFILALFALMNSAVINQAEDIGSPDQVFDLKLDKRKPRVGLKMRGHYVSTRKEHEVLNFAATQREITSTSQLELLTRWEVTEFRQRW